MVGRAHPRLPAALAVDELPDRDELLRVRRPGWYDAAHALVLAAGPRASS